MEMVASIKKSRSIGETRYSVCKHAKPIPCTPLT